MTKRCVVLAAALLLPGIVVSVESKLQGADKEKKSPDALETTRAFLNFACTGQAKAAAELGEPGKSPGRAESIERNFKNLNGKKPPAIVRFLADGDYALAITEVVVIKEKQVAPLSIRLVKKNKRWLVHDIDGTKEQADNNLKRFQRDHPKAKEVKIPKKDK